MQETFTEALSKIQQLAKTKQKVATEEIPMLFREDILNFHLGATICFDEKNRPCFHPWDFKTWVDKVSTQGLSHSLNVPF